GDDYRNTTAAADAGRLSIAGGWRACAVDFDFAFGGDFPNALGGAARRFGGPGANPVEVGRSESVVPGGPWLDFRERIFPMVPRHVLYWTSRHPEFLRHRHTCGRQRTLIAESGARR